jgi:uncharacterized membrane protein
MQQAAFQKFTPNGLVSAIADFLLAGMVIGPIAAPFLERSGVFVPSVIAQIIYGLGSHVCPQPEMGLMLAPPQIMAVCTRCYGTVLGLFFTRLLFAATKGEGFFWLTRYGWLGAVISSLLMMAYPAEYVAQMFGGWDYHHSVAITFGAIAGLGWGLHLMPVVHRVMLKSQ